MQIENVYSFEDKNNNKSYVFFTADSSDAFGNNYYILKCIRNDEYILRKTNDLMRILTTSGIKINRIMKCSVEYMNFLEKLPPRFLETLDDKKRMNRR